MSPRHRAIVARRRARLREPLLRARPAGRMRSPAIRNSRGRSIASCWKTPAVERKSSAPAPAAEGLSGHSQSFGRVLTIVAGDCALLERDGKLALLSLPVAERWLRQAQLTPEVEPVCAQPLLIPLRLKASAAEKAALDKAQSALALLGIDLQSDAQHLTVRAVPLPLKDNKIYKS